MFASSEQQKINSGFYLFEAEQKTKKAKKDRMGKQCLHQRKNMGNIICDTKIVEVPNNSDSTVKDERFNYSRMLKRIYVYLLKFSRTKNKMEKSICKKIKSI